MKKFVAMMLAVVMVLALVACGGSATPANTKDSAVKKVIKEAQGMTLEELCKKAIEESNGATFYGVGNSSRGSPLCRCSSSICRRWMQTTTLTSNGSSRRTTRSSIS